MEPKNIIQISLRNRNTLTDTENKVMAMQRKGGGGRINQEMELTHTHYYIQNRQATWMYSIAHGTIFNILQQPIMKKKHEAINLKLTQYCKSTIVKKICLKSVSFWLCNLPRGFPSFIISRVLFFPLSLPKCLHSFKSFQSMYMKLSLIPTLSNIQYQEKNLVWYMKISFW